VSRIVAIRKPDVQPAKCLGQLDARDGSNGLDILRRERPAQFPGREGDLLEPEPGVDGAAS
jgi:hypothetical protein